jgi:hypothetical protein
MEYFGVCYFVSLRNTKSSLKNYSTLKKKKRPWSKTWNQMTLANYPFVSCKNLSPKFEWWGCYSQAAKEFLKVVFKFEMYNVSHHIVVHLIFLQVMFSTTETFLYMGYSNVWSIQGWAVQGGFPQQFLEFMRYLLSFPHPSRKDNYKANIKKTLFIVHYL